MGNSKMKTGIVNANYTPAENRSFLGNPNYEAMPTDEELLDKLDGLGNMPYVSNEMRNSLSVKEKHYILDEVDSAVFLLPHHYNTFEKVNKMIKQGYLYRNPMTTEYVQELNRLGRELQTGSFCDPTILKSQNGCEYAEGGSKIMAMFGVSGTGKSTCKREILKLFPKAIYHQNYEGKRFNALQIPCVQILCPSECSLQSICSDFFEAIDNIAETNYRARYGGTTKDISILVNRMRALGALYGVGLLVIDELQDLVDSRQDTSTVKTFISQLSNKVGFPVLLIGTVNAKELFTTGSSKRRIISGGEDEWDLMAEGDNNWNHVINELWKTRILSGDTSDVVPTEINKALFLASQGNLNYLKTIFLDAQRIALEADEDMFSCELIRTALKDSPTISEIVTAISDNNLSLLAELGDVVMDDVTQSMSRYKKNYEYQEKIINLTRTRIENRQIRSNENLRNVIAGIRAAEIAKNLNEEELESIVEKVINKSKEDSIETIFAKSIEAAKLESDSKKPKKLKKKTEYKLYKNEGESNYDALKREGYGSEDL